MRGKIADLEPFSDRVIVLVDQTPLNTNIALADEAEETMTGTVLFAGQGRLPENGVERQPMTARVGDKVWFNKHAGDNYRLDDEGNPVSERETQYERLIKCLIEDAIIFRLG